MECPFSAVLYRTCHRMHSRHVPFCLSLFLSLAAPPAAPPLSPIPAPLLSSITHRPACLPFAPTSYRPCRLLGTSIVPLQRRRPRQLRSRSPIVHAHAYRIRSPHCLTPSIPPRRPDIAAGSTVSSHGSARGGDGEPDMPVRCGSARLLMAFVGYDRCRTVCPFPQVIGVADTRY